MTYDSIRDKIVLIPRKVDINSVEVIGDYLWDQPIKNADFVFLYGYIDAEGEIQPIEKDQVKQWGCQPTYEYALKNTEKLYRSKYFREFDREIKIENCRSDFIAVSNSKSRLGAVSIFYPGNADKVAKALGGDFYFSFISLDDCMCHKIGTIDPEKIKEFVLQTNHIYDDGYGLSNKVYKYNFLEKSFEMLDI